MFNRTGHYIKEIFTILVHNRGKMLLTVENFNSFKGCAEHEQKLFIKLMLLINCFVLILVTVPSIAEKGLYYLLYHYISLIFSILIQMNY